MKLLIYSHYFAPSVGGVESIVLSLARGLAELRTPDGAREFDVVVATQTPAQETRRGYPSAESHLRDELSADHKDAPAATRYDDGALPFRVVRQPGLWALWRLIRQSDALHLAGPAMSPMMLALLMRKPLVLEHHGFQAVCPNGQLFQELTASACPGYFMAGRHRECWRCNVQAGRWRSLRMWALTFPRRCLCRLGTVNVAPTRWLEGVLRLPRAIVILHGLVDQDAGESGRLALAPPPLFVYLGRLVSTKGVNLLLEAAHELRKRGLPFLMALIGDGPERTILEERSQAFGMNGTVHFLGYLQEPALKETLQAAAAVIVPSIAGEVFGLVAAENMMRGRLLIVPEGGALAEVVGDAGIKFRLGDAQALADAMQQVLREPSLIALYGARARQRALALFRRERMIAEHARVYREVAAKARP